MKVSFTPYAKTHCCTQSRQSNQYSHKPLLSPSFKSDCDDYSSEIINLAQKYKYVLNPRYYIMEEISWCESLNDGVEKVLTYINKLKLEEKQKEEKLTKIEDAIKQKNTREKEIQQQDAEMLDKIAKIQIENIVDRIKLQKILVSQKRKQQVCSELKTKYADLFKLENKIFPNGIMIKGMDDKTEQNEVINFLRNNNCKLLRLDFDKISRKEAAKSILNIKKKIKDSGEHTLLLIDNFNKYMVYNDENFNLINNLKSTLTSCANDYNTTILVFESNPEKLDENIIGRHRFQKLIDVSHIKTDKFCEFMPIYDGYRMVTDDDENAIIDLYLGNYGYNKEVLWVESSEPRKLQEVIDRIGKIKKIDKFKNIKYIQCEQPDSFKNLEGFYPLNNYSKDLKRIYEKRIQSL